MSNITRTYSHFCLARLDSIRTVYFYWNPCLHPTPISCFTRSVYFLALQESIVTGVNRSSFPTANIDTWRSPNCPYVNPIKESNFVRLSHAYRILSALNIPEKHNGVFKTHTTGDKYDGFEKRVCYVEGTHYMITVVPSVSKEKRPQDKVKVIANRMTSSELKPR